MNRRTVFVCPTPGCHGGCYGTSRHHDGVDYGHCHAATDGPGTYNNDGTPPTYRPVPCNFTWRRDEDWKVFRVVLAFDDAQERVDAEGEELSWPPLPCGDQEARHQAAEAKSVAWAERAARWKP